MNKNTIIHTLQSGICEITHTDEYSVEHSIIATLSPTHLPDGTFMVNFIENSARKAINMFNVNTEKYQTISVENIIDIEQLTGVDAVNNENKLRAGTEYLEQLDLFNIEDLYTDEHPDDRRNHTLMAASVHNLILSWNEMHLVQQALGETVALRTDGNSVRELNVLREKIAKQRDEGYPARDYPFWRNYFEGSKK